MASLTWVSLWYRYPLASVAAMRNLRSGYSFDLRDILATALTKHERALRQGLFANGNASAQEGA